MKYLFLLFFIFVSFAAMSDKSGVTYRVRSVEALDEENEVMVTFWDDPRVYRLKKDSRVLPCLENGYKAKIKVNLLLDQEAQVIKKCKLFGPGRR